MAKRIHLNFLQYLLDHQNSNDNYFNRYFVLRARLIKEHGHFGFNVDRAKEHLIKAGYIQDSADARPLYVTNDGTQFLHRENQVRLLGWLERFTNIFNKKLSAVLALLTLLLTCIGTYYALQTKPGDTFLTQNLTLNSIKQDAIN